MPDADRVFVSLDSNNLRNFLSFSQAKLILSLGISSQSTLRDNNFIIFMIRSSLDLI